MKYKMKKLCLLFAVASLTFTSCDDFLDRQEDEKMTFDKIWESRNTTQQYWLNSMSFLPNLNGENVGDKDPYLGASDEASIAYDRAHRYINFGSWNPSNVPFYKMDSYYKGIRECNVFMQNVDRCSDPLITKEELAEWKWQSRFARAYYYFLMMRDYGPVMLLGDEMLDFSATTQALERPRNTWEQCVDYVVSEMTACAESSFVPSHVGLSTSKYGLATKGTCYAVISRLKLYSARDLFNGNQLYRNITNPVDSRFPELSGVNLFPQEYNANKWLEAAEAAVKVIDQGYKLYRTGNGNPYEDYYGITHVTWNSELIWTDRYNNGYTWGIATVPTGVAGTAYGAVGPTQQQVDAYAMNSGRYPITAYENSGSPVIDKESGYSANEFEQTEWAYPVVGWSSLKENFKISAPNMYKDREPRFYVTVFWGGNFWLHGANGKTKISFAKNGNGNKSHDYAKTGYLCNRFYDHTLNSASGEWGNLTFPIFRLGETYLNFIEAVLECKKRGVALPGGYEQKAMEYWADLRDRAGLEPITEVYPNSTTEELIELCRKERRIELAMERHRYFDTRTWMIAEQTDGGPIYGMDTTYPLDKGMSALDTPEGYWKRTVVETRVFKKNHYLYPFSQSELERNKLLKQNYGW